jgi:hypothetical protein
MGKPECASLPSRIVREKRTVRAMIGLYCRARHGQRGGLCADCAELMHYTECRLDACPFGADKTLCARCPIHCYRPTMRVRIKEVMRYAGPRMLWRHPVLALRHCWDSRHGRHDLTKGS